ncbi:MAG: MAPEG family protein [Candidatus Dadabacteria bacterium]|nr:MAG: MAPEG family protein [Candidatus Dadabacteria bacterium]
MPSAVVALIVFVLWTILLLLAIAVARIGKVMRGQARATDFPGGVPHGTEAYWRLNRAHANCVENLPLFAALVLSAAATGYSNPTFDQLAWAVALARIPQSLVHISSGSEVAINARFAFFAVQVFSMSAMAIMLLQA